MSKIENKYKDDDDSDVKKTNEDDDVEIKKDLPEDLTEEIKEAINLRIGLSNYDKVSIHHLWDNNYRINCIMCDKWGNRIKKSYFIKYSKLEGIITSYPPMPYEE